MVLIETRVEYEAIRQPVRLWILSDLHLKTVPHSETFRPVPGFTNLAFRDDWVVEV